MLANHGPVVAGKDVEAACNAIEELEATARLALLLRGTGARGLSDDQVRRVVVTVSTWSGRHEVFGQPRLPLDGPPLPEAILAAAAAGFDAVECHWPYETDPGAVAEALSALRPADARPQHTPRPPRRERARRAAGSRGRGARRHRRGHRLCRARRRGRHPCHGRHRQRSRGARAIRGEPRLCLPRDWSNDPDRTAQSS
jgi:hypothetical protein